MPHTHDVIIIGRGIAGVVLSETLHAMGKRVAVFDVPKSNAASPVAAGIVNPVAMRRIIASWRAAEMLDLAEPFYRSLEHEYGEALWHPLPLGRLFANEREAQEWPQRMRDPEVGSFLSEGALPGFDAGKFNAPHGYGVVKRCAWLDVEVMREAHRSKWTAMNALIEREVLPTDVLTTDDGVEVFDCSAPWIVWCNGPFAALPGLVPTRGEVMSLHLPELDIEAMVHRNGFLLPVGNNNYKLGSTFAWSDVWSGPTESGREELVRKLNGLLGHVGSPPLSEEGVGVSKCPASAPHPAISRLDRLGQSRRTQRYSMASARAACFGAVVRTAFGCSPVRRRTTGRRSERRPVPR
ncbi:MAG: FAD-binding oxidoreductase [Flavobacteriales bacterium]|nr:FAD-binding oxidoreductase [Flavobacteriales bacterium]